MFANNRSITVSIPSGLSILLIVLPSTRNNTCPRITLVIFSSTTRLLSLRGFNIERDGNLIILSIRGVRSFFHSSGRVTILSFTSTVHLSIFRGSVPSRILRTRYLHIRTKGTV